MRGLWHCASLVLAVALGLGAGAPAAAQSESEADGLAELLGGGDVAGFSRATRPHPFSFPSDHAAHPDYRNEWWYFTGNLATDAGRPFGFELTFFRIGLNSGGMLSDASSAWRSDQLLLAHFAISDIDGERFRYAQRYSRVALGLAGYRRGPFSLWLEDWTLRHDPATDTFEISAADAEISMQLQLRPQKPPVLNGDRGLSQKSAAAGNASHYYSLTRLDTRGELRVGDANFEVSGNAWMDREWSTSALADDQVGWDWFALQFSDGSELMYYQLRRADGDTDPHSAGTYVDQDGMATHITAGEVELEVLDDWDSPRGGVYPARWALRVESLGLDVTVVPRLADQELATFPRYWEGAVEVSGTRQAERVSGLGYVELTGYADRPLPQ